MSKHHTHHTASPKNSLLGAFLFFSTIEMRKITKASVQAFKDGKNFKLSNTEVFDGGYIQMYLFWNLIAQVRNGVLLIKDAGRRSKTTKERLNGILEAFWLGYIYPKGKDTENKTAWYYVDQYGNEEKRDDWKTIELNKN